MAQRRHSADFRGLSGQDRPGFRFDQPGDSEQAQRAEQALRRNLYPSSSGQSFPSPLFALPPSSPAGFGSYRLLPAPTLSQFDYSTGAGFGGMTHGLPVCGPEPGHVFRPVSDAGAVRHLIRPDPDEELDMYSGRKDSPESCKGLTNAELDSLRARLRALEDGAEQAVKDRLRAEQVMERSNRAVSSLLEELRILRSRQVPTFAPASDANVMRDHPQTDALITRIASSNFEGLTPGQLAATFAYESDTLAQAKRPLSETSKRITLESSKRAKTADEALFTSQGTNTIPVQPVAGPLIGEGVKAIPAQPAAGRSTGEGASSKAAEPIPTINIDQPAHDLLTFLKTMDCRSTASLLRLRAYTTGPRPFEFPLLTETTPKDRLHYILKIGGSLSTPISADPADFPAQSANDSAEIEKLNILELAIGADIAETNNNTPLPQYLIPLGEVYAINHANPKGQEVCSTNFYVLLDIATPQKSIWMFYRYQRPVAGAKGGTEWKNTDGPGRQGYFRSGGGGRVCDAVCLLAGVAGWESAGEEMVKVGMECFREGGRKLKGVFMVPALGVMREVVERGWAEGGEKEEEGVEKV